MARTVSTFTINADPVIRAGRRGFTLVELMLAAALSAVVFAAIFSAYIFMARNLARMANVQVQQTQNRRAFYVVSKDVSEAVMVKSAMPSTLILTLASGDLITYTYTAPVAGPPLVPGTLTRQMNVATPIPVLLANLTSFTFQYFDPAGSAGVGLSIKQIQMSYSSAVGDPLNGTRTSDTVVSSRMVLRGKPPLGQ